MFIKTTVKTLTGELITIEHDSILQEQGLKEAINKVPKDPSYVWFPVYKDIVLFLKESNIRKLPYTFYSDDFLKKIEDCVYEHT